jgi:1,4-alpha-glucan branching enzyme
LNALYKSQPALYEKQFSVEGFEWINYSDNENSVLAYIRKGINEKENLIVVCNMTPVIHDNYRIGLPSKGMLTEIFNSDKVEYNGSGVSNAKPIKIEKESWNGREFSAEIVLAPLGICVFKIG